MINLQGLFSPARHRLRRVVVAAGAGLAVAVAGVPLTAGAAAAVPAAAGSAWGRHTSVKVPSVEVGRNRPVASVTTLAAAAAAGARTAPAGAAGALAAPPTGQGQVPWHQYSDPRLTAAHFTAGTGAAYVTPPGYSQDLVKNSDGTYTLTDRKSRSKDTCTSAGVLAKVTDHNGATITVTQHTGGGSDARGRAWLPLALSVIFAAGTVYTLRQGQHKSPQK